MLFLLVFVIFHFVCVLCILVCICNTTKVNVLKGGVVYIGMYM